MIFWHSKNQFCSICGHKTILNELGTRRDCLQCKANHFPRTDPVAIMLVYKGNKCLLGRKKEFPKGSYSCLAGFIGKKCFYSLKLRRIFFFYFLKT